MSGLDFVAVLGLDQFHKLRAQVGSVIANACLQELCGRIESHLPEAGIGRVGRTTIEFAFAGEGETQARRSLLSLHGALEQPVVVEGHAYDLAISIGVAAVVEGAGEDVLIEGAEQALARAQSGHAKFEILRAADAAEASERLGLMRDLRQALSGDQLWLAYQPKLHTRSNTIDSVEALVRWAHPSFGAIPPDRFISLAEGTGDIKALTQLVFAAAVRDQHVLARAGHDIAMHVNLSGALVADEDFGAWIIAQCGGSAGRIGLEITETAVISDPERALRNLRALRAAGIALAIDDYGSGLSSLAYLKELPANELKIDKLFISNLASSHRDPLIVRSTIDLAHALEMQVTAEGVDDPTTLALLRIMGCDRVQGYLVAPPLPLAGLIAMLDKAGEAGVEPAVGTVRRQAR